MKFQSLSMFCKSFFRSYRIPITCVNDHCILFQYPLGISQLDILSLISVPEDKKSDSMSYFTAFDLLVFGRVLVKSKTENVALIVGPVTMTVLSTANIQLLLVKANIGKSDDISFLQLLNNIPLLNMERFFDVISFVNYCLTDTWIESKSFLNINDKKLIKELEASRTIFTVQNKEQQVHHDNSYYIAKQLATCIRNGDLEGLAAIDQNYSQSITPRILSDDNLRNNKNMFITLVTIINQAAIEGGVDIQIAFELSDSYIRQCEKATSFQQVAQLINRVSVDFITRVKESQMPKNISDFSFKCVQYINNHTNSPLTVNEIADHFQMSRSYMSTVFKHDLGFTIKEFIVRRKIEEAKSLLSYTNMPISEISNYLYFSSQAHFQTIFKKKVGVTPQNFRIKNV